MMRSAEEVTKTAERGGRKRRERPAASLDATAAGKMARPQPACRESLEPLPAMAPPADWVRNAARSATQHAALRIALQSGALAYRVTTEGKIRVLLVSKRRSKRWGIPKGKAEPYLSLAENAAKEAFEEAGVRGRVTPHAAGSFRTVKQGPVRLSKIAIEVWVYLLEVTELSADWPEKGKRRTKWVSCRKAAELLGEPLLASLCRRLAESPPSF